MEILEVIIRRRVPVERTGTDTNDTTSRSLSGELPESYLSIAVIASKVQFLRSGSSPPAIKVLELMIATNEELRS